MLGPIFIREWRTVPRRAGHYVIRSAYLGFLWILGLTAWQATVGWSRAPTLGDNARFGRLLFEGFTILQLIVIPFFAALSAASAVAKEKDRRTFILLLLTDLRSYEIVLGKMLGSLLQILILLLGTIPVLALLMLLGGIAPTQVGQAALVVVATALAAGSLGNLIAVWREKTFQALALTVLFIVLYLCLARALPAVVEQLHVGPSAADAEIWLSWIDPHTALQNVLDYSPAEKASLPSAFGFVGVMVGWAVLADAVGIWGLRVWNPGGEPIMQREKPDEDEDKNRAHAHAAPGKPRQVWANPILWREIRTRAYGHRPVLVKLAYFLAIGLVGYAALAPIVSGTDKSAFAAAYGLLPVGILSMLLVAAQAVTAITSERDSGALDLLLVTDLTPGEFIFGKLLGIAWNTKEYLVPPLVLAIVYACLGVLATPPTNHPELLGFKNVEAAVPVVITTLVLLIFAMVLGVHVALRTPNSQLAVIHTLSTVFFLSVGTLVCIYLILINGRFEYQWTSFILYTAAGIGGLWWVLNGEQPSTALTLASWFCPAAVLYSVINILMAKPGSAESADPLNSFVLTAGAFGFTVVAMLMPLLSEFDVALGRTTAARE